MKQAFFRQVSVVSHKSLCITTLMTDTQDAGCRSLIISLTLEVIFNISTITFLMTDSVFS